MNKNMPWLSKMNQEWPLIKGKYLFKNEKKLVKEKHNEYPRLALTLNGVVERSKVDSEGLQPTDYSSYQIFNKGNLVFKLIDLENKQTSRVGIAHKDGIMSPAYIRLEKNNKAINEYFAYFYYLSLYYQDVYRDLGKGVRSSLSATELLEIPVPVPPIWVQEKIVKFINYKVLQTLNLKQSLEKQIDNLKEYRSSLITQAVTKGLDPNVPMKDSGIKWLGEVPEHWEKSKLKYLAQIGPSKSEVSKLRNVKVSFLPMEKIGQNKLILDEVKDISEVYSGYTYCKDGDVIVAKVTPCFENGNVAVARNLVNGIGFGTSEIYTLRPFQNKILPEFLSYLFQSEPFRSKAISSMYGVGGLKRIPSEFFECYELYIPSITEQQLIINSLDKKIKTINNLISKINEQLNKLEEYRSSLITAAVTRQIDVSNWTPTQEEELENIL